MSLAKIIESHCSKWPQNTLYHTFIWVWSSYHKTFMPLRWSFITWTLIVIHSPVWPNIPPLLMAQTLLLCPLEFVGWPLAEFPIFSNSLWNSSSWSIWKLISLEVSLLQPLMWWLFLFLTSHHWVWSWGCPFCSSFSLPDHCSFLIPKEASSFRPYHPLPFPDTANFSPYG